MQFSDLVKRMLCQEVMKLLYVKVKSLFPVPAERDATFGNPKLTQILLLNAIYWQTDSIVNVLSLILIFPVKLQEIDNWIEGRLPTKLLPVGLDGVQEWVWIPPTFKRLLYHSH